MIRLTMLAGLAALPAAAHQTGAAHVHPHAGPDLLLIGLALLAAAAAFSHFAARR